MDCRVLSLKKLTSFSFKFPPLHVVNAFLFVLLVFVIFISLPSVWFAEIFPSFLHLYKEAMAPKYMSREVAVYLPSPEEPPKAENYWPVVRSVVDPSGASENEALAIMQAAQQFVQMGKYDKASKLFEHAFLMQPRHPDILTEYGLFTEKVEGDVVKANLMYCTALVYNPEHSLAILHRGRTQPLVQEVDAEMLRVLDHDQHRFSRIPRDNSVLIRTMREAYFKHIYHTVAMEGNTMSLIQTRSLLETRLAIGGKSLMEHNEILGMDAALKYLNVSLVRRIGLLTVEDIQEIHRRVYGFIDPIEAGHFRRHQVFVGDFEPTAPGDIKKEMAALIEWLNQDTTMRIHPVELAALLHYKFIVIHPFVDGNGRTARLLMNLVLMQAGFPPVIIRVHDRLEYYETLKIGNAGDIRPFIRFIAKATKRTLKEYLDDVDADSSNGTLITKPAHNRFVDDGRTILVN